MSFLTEDLAHLVLQLSRLSLIVQAAVLDGEFFGFLSPFDDCGVSPEVGVSGGDVADTLMVTVVKDRAYVGDLPEGYILLEGDIIVAMTEQGPGLLGSSAIIPEGNRYLHNQRLGLVQSLDAWILNKRFVYYLFNTRGVRGQISGSVSGTKVRHTSPERVYRVRVKIPDSECQTCIASILSAYDDLIENNRRPIVLLERAARAWFPTVFGCERPTVLTLHEQAVARHYRRRF